MAAISFPSPFPSSLVTLPPQPRGVDFPAAGPNGWPEGEPTGADVDRLQREVDRAFAAPNEVDSPGLGQSLALVVVQGGMIVAERYHPEVGPGTPLISWSMAKSVTQALAGVLVRDAMLDVGAVGPQLHETWTDDRRAITLTQLLQMRSGLSWTEEYEDTEDAPLPDVLEMLFGAGVDDMARFAAGRPLAHQPGDHFCYSSGTSNIVSALVTDLLVTRPTSAADREQAMRRFMQAELFDPLGMSSADPRFDTAGTFVGSSYLYATARDFARFGLLYLRDGVWDSRRLLPEGWVDAARTAQAVEPDSLNWYGQHWWVYPCAHGSFRASGYEGQAVLVVPGLDLVVVRLGKTPFANGNDPLFLHLAEIISCFE